MEISGLSAGKVKYVPVVIGLVLATLVGFVLPISHGNPKIGYTAAVAVLMAVWWVTEAIPIGVTSLIPLVLFPLLGVMDGKDASNAYINYVIFLFLGGFMMALAMEKCKLHRRIALWILSLLGGHSFTILLGFMLASSFLSMWMSNTATAMMMLPIALSVGKQLEESHGKKNVKKFSTTILLSIAYACSAGGVATLVGTPPNLSFVRIFNILFPEAKEISFGEWLVFAFPISVSLFAFILLLLYVKGRPKEAKKKFSRGFFKKEYKKLGQTSVEQKRVLVAFITLVLLWVFRKDLLLGNLVIKGWSTWFENPEYINDGTVAISVALLLFLIPSGKKQNALMDWNTARKIPWQIVLLYGGGFALAQGFVDSGLSVYIGEKLRYAESFSTLGLVTTLTTTMTFLTEFTSNTATTEMLLPIVAGLSVQIEVNPLLFMIPVTLAGSMAFMFPVATPPNAIIYGSGKVTMWEMAKTGLLLNLIAIVIITFFTLFWLEVALHIDSSSFPDWAKISERFE